MPTLLRDCWHRYGEDGRAFVFKTKSGSVLQLNAHQLQPNRNVRPSDDDSDQDEPLPLPPHTGRISSDAPRTGSISGAQVSVPPLARSSSFHPRSSSSGGGGIAAPRLERAVSCAIMEVSDRGGCEEQHDKEEEGVRKEEVQEGGGGKASALALEGEEHEYADGEGAQHAPAKVDGEDGTGALPRQDVVAVEAESWANFLVNYVPAFRHVQVGAVMR
jgi:hypothetical protein